jgi:hypothetical protein
MFQIHRPLRKFAPALLLIAAVTGTGIVVAQHSYQPPPGLDPLHRPYDQMLDGWVRDGMVYYGAVRAERARLDRYVASLNVPEATYDAWSQEQKIAFWLNAYNAFVLQTVGNHYPIRGKSKDYPSSSIRQIPGAFERTKHRAAGRSVTLDEIEKSILPEFKEPRLYLALGRGAVGSGRLRSEAYSAASLAKQLDAVAADFLRHKEMVLIDRTGDRISFTPIVSWREAEFVAKYDTADDGVFAQRSAIERAMLAFITPHLLPLEKRFLSENRFRITFHDFDWRLNDLTGGRID